MLAKKINITNMISQNDFKTIKSYSNLLSDAYNLCLDELRKNPDFKQIQRLILRKNMGYYDLATHSISTPC